jgi:hypothetical protein
MAIENFRTNLSKVPEENRQDFRKIKYVLMKIKFSGKFVPGDEYYFEQLVLDKKKYIEYDETKEKWILTSKGNKFLKGLDRLD